MDKVQILKNTVNDVSIQQLHNRLTHFIETDRKAIVDYLNIYSANISYKEEWFRNFLNSCDVILCDGKGIQLGAHLLGERVPVQIPYNRWLWDFFSYCEENNYSIFFMGSAPGVYERAMEQITEKGYNIKMAGYHGYFNKENKENDDAIALVNDFKPDFLLVGFGMPIQEKWVMKNQDKVDAKVIILGGAYLDWISGDVKTPPTFVSKWGMEWLYRLSLEPRRLAHRYLVGIPQFFYRIIVHKSMR